MSQHFEESYLSTIPTGLNVTVVLTLYKPCKFFHFQKE